MNKKVLLLDDDPSILSAYRRNLRNLFEIETAEDGATALEIIKERGPFAVVVSDFRMPGMDGIQFLTRVKQLEPDTVRVMLTGQADIQMSIQAINEGSIFRFFTKPCKTEHLINALKASIDHYHLIVSERELLNKTLKGSVKVMIDTLSLVSPVALNHSSRIRKLANHIAKEMGVQNLWEIDMAALLSQIGCVTVPTEILEKKYSGQNLTSQEKEVFFSHYQTGKKLLENIPRLEGIAQIIAHQSRRYDNKEEVNSKKDIDVPLSARILKVAIDFDEHVQLGMTCVASVKLLKDHLAYYDPAIVSVLEKIVLSHQIPDLPSMLVKRSICLKDVKIGMILAEDIKLRSGVVLITKGHEITEIFKIRLNNAARLNRITEPIVVLDRV
jgi:response regulator RpfG family c-di-GMP phosphodiesterase